MSSQSMAAVALGGSPSQIHAPCDPSDFKRCVEFLECIDPSRRDNLILEMSRFTKRWDSIARYWFQLFELWNKEKKQQSAPELYAYMKKLGL